MRTFSVWLLLLVLAAVLAASCGDGGEEAPVLTPTGPAPTQSLSPFPPPTLDERLYSEDFEDGMAQGWTLGPAWQVTREDGNTVLLGREIDRAIFNDGGDSTNYAFRFRFKVRSGTLLSTYRVLQAREMTRYYIGFDRGDRSLYRQVGDDHNNIAEGGIFPRRNTWHTVEIKAFEGRLQVFVDGEIELDVTDEDPLLQGTIGFDSGSGSEFVIDDIEVALLTEPLTSPPPSFTAFAGEPEGLGEGLNILSAIEARHILAAPDTRLITVVYDNTTRRARVTAKAGAVPQNAAVLVGNTELGDFVLLNADSQGAFEAEVDGHPGHARIDQAGHYRESNLGGRPRHYQLRLDRRARNPVAHPSSRSGWGNCLWLRRACRPRRGGLGC